MPKRLVDILLNEISLVDDPANPHATVSLFKRNTKETEMDPKELKEKLEKAESDLQAVTTERDELKTGKDDLQKQHDALTKQVESLEKAAEKAGFEVSKSDKGEITITKKAEPEYVEIDGEKVEKGSVPKAVLKRLETLEANQEREALAKRAQEEYPNLKGTPEQKAELLKALDGIEDEETRKAVTESLTAADKAVSAMFKEAGNIEPDENSATYKFNKRVEEVQKDEKCTFEQAFSKFLDTKEGAALYRESEKEAN